MTDEKRLTLKARWDRNRVPAGRSCQRNLLIEITAPPKPEPVVRRSRVNLSLVVDRSGSMRGPRIAAARQAAVDIVDLLNERDRLSLVIFDDEIETLIEARAMDAAGRRAAKSLIERLHSRGTTNLAAGWFEGARCAAGLLDDGRFPEGFVFVLSDGYANRGICDPGELQRHAGELAERGVKTSALGIGHDYSPLQLDALAEGGRGRLHDAETADDIIDVVRGELGEIQAITARDVEVTIECFEGIGLDLLTRLPVERDGGRYRIQLGDLIGDSTRPIAVRADIPAFRNTDLLPFGIVADWRRSAGQQVPGRERIDAPLRVVPPAEADAQASDREVVERIATLWEAALAYRAMRFNEQQDYVRASELYEDNLASYENLVSELPDAAERMLRAERSRACSSRPWAGRSKLQAYTLSKKFVRAHEDLRSHDYGDWHDHLEK